MKKNYSNRNYSKKRTIFNRVWLIEKIFFYKKNRFFLIGKEKKHLIPFELNEKKKKKTWKEIKSRGILWKFEKQFFIHVNYI